MAYLPETKKEVISKFRTDMLTWERFKTPSVGTQHITGLKAIEAAFPNGIFPVGTVHEFLCFEPEQTAASGGFIAGLLSVLMKQGGVCLWIGTSRKLFPPALKAFGVAPHRIIFIDLLKQKDVLWATAEAFKCKGIAAVISEVKELNFTQSRRLQLAVENSRVTGFILRSDPRKLCTTTSTARWQITPVPSEPEEGMPGVGYPRWRVDLLKVRNGKPGSWRIEWSAGRFVLITENRIVITLQGQVRKVS